MAKSGAKRLSEGRELSPPGGTKVNFASAVIFARKIVVSKKLVMLTSSHRGMSANVENGWLIIDQKWYLS